MHEHVHGLSGGQPGPRASKPIDDRLADDGSTDDGSTGDAAVDAALTRLDGLEATAVREHVGVFDAVHHALQDRLADTEE